MKRLVGWRFTRSAKVLQKKASALVTTLLVLVVLSTIAVAFMQSMSIERMTAQSQANRYRAILAADSAVEVALKSLSVTTNKGPFSTTFARDASGAPYLYQVKLTNDAGTPVLLRLPQFTTRQPTSLFTNTATPGILTNAFTLDDKGITGGNITRNVTRASDIVQNLNPVSAARPNGTIGLTSNSVALPIFVNWSYITDNDGRIVGRYAYWIDDESSKIDLRTAGNSAGPGHSHLRLNGAALDEVSLQVLGEFGISQAVIANLLNFKTHAADRLTVSQARYGMAPASDISDSDWQILRPHLTMYSLHDDRAPDGRRKLNLNDVVTDTFDEASITEQVALIRDTILANAPSFGTRYYKQHAEADTTVSGEDQTNYVTKLAANIRDFIDSDRNITVILDGGDASSTNGPAFVPYDLNDSEIPVAGKEGGPFLNEYLRVLRVIAPVPDTMSGNANLRTITIRATHYVELWNLGPRTITYDDLSPNPFIELAHRTPWHNLSTTTGAQPNTIRPPGIRMYLPTDFEIVPGGYAVITTGTNAYGIASPAFLTRLPGDTMALDAPQPGTWQVVDEGGQTEPNPGNAEDYDVSTTRDSEEYDDAAGDADGSYGSSRERLTFGNDNGLFDYSLRIHTDATQRMDYDPENPKTEFLSTFIADNSSSTTNNTPNGKSTDPRYTRGDPRSNTESIALGYGTGGSWKNGGLGDGTTPYQETLGIINYNLTLQPTGVALWRMGWNEYTSDPAGNHYVANNELYSLGQLGSIYDPARYDSAGYRGAGRTLRIGQSDEPTNNRAGDIGDNTPGSGYANWLGGVGTSNLTNSHVFLNSDRLVGMFRTDGTNYGRVNPNSVMRGEHPLALRAVFDNFEYTTNDSRASSMLAGRPIHVTNLMEALRTSIADGQPLVGVGSLGRLAIFSSGTNLAGVEMADVSDAGKEELFRRSANLLTTESLAFTIFTQAQAGKFRRDAGGADRFYPTATVTRQTTVQFVPTYPAGEDRPLPSAWTIRIMRDQIN